jgi:phosphate acetyltransferase
MKTCISTYSYHRLYKNGAFTDFDAIDQTKEFGADGVELLISEDLVPAEKSLEEYVRELTEHARSIGLEVPMYTLEDANLLCKDPEAALSRIVERYKAVEAKCDAVVIVGSDYTDVGSPTELSFNARVAANLGAPVLLVLGGRSAADGTTPRTGADMRQVAEVTTAELRNEHASLLAVVANRVDPEHLVGGGGGGAVWHTDTIPAETRRLLRAR